MQIAVERCCNHKEQIGGLSIHRAVVYPLCQRHRCQRRSAHRIRFGMRNSNALLDGGAAHLFPCQNRFSVRLFIGNTAACCLQFHQFVDCLFFIKNMRTQHNALGAE